MRAFAITVVLTGVLARATSLSAAQSKDGPVDVLLRVQRLDDETLGEGAVRSEAYDAFSKLYRAGQPSLGAAKRLVESGTPAAQIYGYLILRHISPPDARTVDQRISGDQTQVTVQNGCEVWQSTVGVLVKRMQKGDAIIELPKS